MAVGRYPYFSRSGWLPFSVCAGLGVFVGRTVGWAWSLPFWLVCGAIIYMFRDPDREIPSSPLAVVSPADGQVVAIARVQDPYLGREAIRLDIQMDYVGVYSIRSPVEGKILEPQHSGEGDQRHGVWLKTDEDDDLVVVMHSGPLHNLPRCYARIGERIGQGQRCGYMRMGGQVEVYLPSNSRVRVNDGSQVKAGSDVIATLVHK